MYLGILYINDYNIVNNINYLMVINIEATILKINKKNMTKMK